MLKDKVKELRESGYTIRQIADSLKCSRSTASLYSRGIQHSAALSANIIARRTAGSLKAAEKRHNARTAVIREADKEWEQIKHDVDIILFLGLYWGEGRKKIRIEVANNDPYLIKRCVECLIKLGPLAKMVADIKIYPDHDHDEIVNFWTKFLGVAVRVNCSRIKDCRSGRKIGKSKYGICYLRLNNWILFAKISRWLELLKGAV